MSAARRRKAISIIESSRVPVVPKPAAGAPRARAGAARWRQLAFPLQHQQHVNWCWAAVAASVALYYRPRATWTQCKVADVELQRCDCCGSGGRRRCNVPGHLDTSLRIVGRLARRQWARSTFAQAEREVRARRPLGARIQWPNGDGHFATIVGFLAGRPRMLAIDDPYYGRSHVDYRTFCRGYYHGKWTDSYFTKR
ncbi:MAG TPA: papain-like cysteine protease family protein [Candidatus Sulfotelmatobacter sp.]|nr:papain-like cysteine protease family protein [Candidatus Sulfotelmatobacter sp.]